MRRHASVIAPGPWLAASGVRAFSTCRSLVPEERIETDKGLTCETISRLFVSRQVIQQRGTLTHEQAVQRMPDCPEIEGAVRSQSAT